VAPWFLGKDPDNSTQGDSHVIQGLQVTDAAAPGELLRCAGQGHDLQAGERLVRFPGPLMHLFPELSSGR
jgi:hypothetical protein